MSSDLPTSWGVVALGDLGLWRGGGTPSKARSDFWTGGQIPWVSPKDMKADQIHDAEDHITQAAVDSSATSVLPSDSVLLVVRSGILEHTLPVALTRVPVALNQDLKAITPHRGIHAPYLALALRGAGGEILRACAKSGTTVASLEFPALLAFPIAIAPQKEQHRIVEEVEKQFTRLDAAVAGLRRVRANLKRYRASVLKAACEGRLVPPEAELARREGRSFESGEALLKRILKERRARWEADQFAKRKAVGKAPRNDQWKRQYEEPLRPATAEGDPTPAKWGIASLDELTVFGPQNGLYKPQGNYGTGIPIIRIDDYQDWTHKTRNELRRVEVTDGESLDYAIHGGDLLINRVNSPSHLGKCLLCPADLTGALFESNMMRLRLTESTCPQFVSLYLRSPDGRRRLIGGAKWAVNQASINQKDVGVCPVPLPPFGEQHRIVIEVERRLSVVDEIEATIDKNLGRCTRLRQSILKMAFEGRLVPQDPNDEPASVLLERIRREIRPTGTVTRPKRQAVVAAPRSATSLKGGRNPRYGRTSTEDDGQ